MYGLQMDDVLDNVRAGHGARLEFPEGIMSLIREGNEIIGMMDYADGDSIVDLNEDDVRRFLQEHDLLTVEYR